MCTLSHMKIDTHIYGWAEKYRGVYVGYTPKYRNAQMDFPLAERTVTIWHRGKPNRNSYRTLYTQTQHDMENNKQVLACCRSISSCVWYTVLCGTITTTAFSDEGNFPAMRPPYLVFSVCAFYDSTNKSSIEIYLDIRIPLYFSICWQ